MLEKKVCTKISYCRFYHATVEFIKQSFCLKKMCKMNTEVDRTRLGQSYYISQINLRHAYFIFALVIDDSLVLQKFKLIFLHFRTPTRNYFRWRKALKLKSIPLRPKRRLKLEVKRVRARMQKKLKLREAEAKILLCPGKSENLLFL
jgi:hypothetical protein